VTLRKIVLALVAVAAIVGGLVLIFLGAFPYFYAESGQASYISEHQGEMVAQIAGGVALLAVAWVCMRYSFSSRTWALVGGVIAVVFLLNWAKNYVRVPANARPAGGQWYVVRTAHPDYYDTVLYTVYYKRGPHYRRVADQLSEYRFVAPDCLLGRGLTVSRRPLYAMCGYRKPVETYDTLTAESDLIVRARKNPSF